VTKPYGHIITTLPHSFLSKYANLYETITSLLSLLVSITDYDWFINRISVKRSVEIAFDTKIIREAKKYNGVFVLVANKERDTFEALRKFRKREWIEYFSEELRKMKEALGTPNGDQEHDLKTNIDKEKRLKNRLGNTSIQEIFYCLFFILPFNV